MTIRHLRIFTEVCACKSVTGAAKKLYLAQPSVSLAIRELENHYGVKLFDRIARRLDLTEAGQRLLAYATQIIALFDDMERDVGQFDGQRVSIATSLTIGTCLLPSLARQFSRIHPEIELHAMMKIRSGLLRACSPIITIWPWWKQFPTSRSFSPNSLCRTNWQQSALRTIRFF